MRMLTVGLVLSLSSMGWAGEPTAPDTRASLMLSGRFAVVASACAVEGVVLTNAHVVDVRPFDLAFPLSELRFESAMGDRGIIGPLRGLAFTDLAVVTTSTPLTHFARVAAAEPAPGEAVWWALPSWQSRKRMLERTIVSGRVLRSWAGTLVIDRETESGASGGCVFNGSGEVVGLVTWGSEARDQREATMAVGLWGPWWQHIRAVLDRVGTTPNTP